MTAIILVGVADERRIKARVVTVGDRTSHFEVADIATARAIQAPIELRKP